MNKKRLTIGLFLDQLFSPFETMIWHEVVNNANKYNHNLIVYVGQQLESPHRFRKEENIIYELFKPEQVDGLLVSSGTVYPYYGNNFNDFLRKFTNIPIVSFSYKLDGIHSLVIDNKAGMKKAIKHLIVDHGYKRIAFIKGQENNLEAIERLNAYLEIMKESNLDIDDKLIIEGDFRPASGTKAIEYLEKNDLLDLDAIVCANDDTAIRVLDELQKRDIDVPNQIAVIGFDNLEDTEHLRTPLTTVNQPLEVLLNKSYETLVDLINNKERDKVQYLQSELVIRESCGCFPLIDNWISPEKREALAVGESKKKQLIGKILSCFPSNLSSKSELKIYFQKLREIVGEDLKKDSSGIDWYRISLDLRKEILSKKNIEIDDLNLYKIFEISQILISKIYQRLNNTSTKVRDNNDYTHRELKSDLNFIQDFDEFSNALVKHYKRIGLNRSYLIQYEGVAKRVDKYSWNVPDKSKLLIAYENGQNQLQNKDYVKFRTKNILPDSFFNRNEQFIFAITSLYYQKEQYGFLVNELNLVKKEEQDMYLTIQEYVCTALFNLNMWEKRNQLEAEIKDTLKQLKVSNKKLTELDKMKNDFIENITHDLRSPLSGIQGFSRLALEKASDDTNRERYDLIYRSSLKLSRSIDNLLDLAKLDSNHIKLNIQPVNIDHLLLDIINFYRSELYRGSIIIKYEESESSISNFFSDVQKLEQIFNNLFSNAIKFVDPDNGEIIVRIVEYKDRINIVFKDNGIGIEKKNLETIFDRFEQVQDSRNSIYRGSGIGLAFVKQLLHLMGGDVWAESDGLGKGSTFIVELKKGIDTFNSENINMLDESEIGKNYFNRGDISKNIITSLNDEQNIDEPLFFVNEIQKKKVKDLILIIDDDYVITKLIKDFLISFGYQNLIIAFNGKQGLDIITQYNPDLVICDYNMPVMDGLELLEIVMKSPDIHNIPLIFLTAISDDRTRLLLREKGAVDFVSKPINPEELKIKIEQNLSIRNEYNIAVAENGIDPLTKVANRRGLLSNLNKLLLSRVYKEVCIIMVDIDYFKSINDKYGHLAGDFILHDFATKLKTSIRESDIVGRYGGEEFLIILPETSSSEAEVVVSNIQKKIRKEKIEWNESQINISASYGIASMFTNEKYLAKQIDVKDIKSLYIINNNNSLDWSDIKTKKKELAKWLIDAADKALYNAKKSSCNECGYLDDEKAFQLGCKKCGSKKYTQGRDKYKIFNEI